MAGKKKCKNGRFSKTKKSPEKRLGVHCLKKKKYGKSSGGKT